MGLSVFQTFTLRLWPGNNRWSYVHAMSVCRIHTVPPLHRIQETPQLDLQQRQGTEIGSILLR